MRRKVIAGNWKMNGLKNSIIDINPIISFSDKAKSEVILFPPVTLISSIISISQTSNLSIGAQDCHQNNEGAHTGDVSPKMLKDLGAKYVIIGHSERRQAYKESDNLLKEKMRASWQNELTTILCIGEDLNIARQSKTDEHITEQLNASLSKSGNENNLIIAYEPIWAIGTGEIPSINQIKNTHTTIRNLLLDKFGKSIGSKIRIIYGGSLNMENAKEIFEIDNVDGGLVGGASLTPTSFIPIIQALENSIQ